MTSGPAAGQTGRIVDYEYIGDIDQNNLAVPTYTRLFRFRVMSFQRKDGQPLQITTRPPEISDLAGATFIVNGRAYGGTGVGYNPLAGLGQPKLSALQAFPVPFDLTTNPNPSTYVGAELALLPNPVYFNPLNGWSSVAAIDPSPMPIDPFSTALPTASFLALNSNKTNTPSFNYPKFAGPGDMNESYDAPDYNDIWLACKR